MINTRADVQNVLSQMRQMRSQMQVQDQQQAMPRPNGPQNPAAQAMNATDPSRQAEGVSENSRVDLPHVRGAAPDQNVQDPPRFGEMFKSAIDTVNASSQYASEMRTAFEEGRPGVTLPDVMIAANKSSVSFSATTEVRNKLIEAYKEIMNMPV